MKRGGPAAGGKAARRNGRPLVGYLEGRKLREAARLLSSGAITVLPTDTLYGFHCAVSSGAAIERIRALKGRRRGMGYILLASDLAMVDSMVAGWPSGSRAALGRIWPAPFTAVLRASSRVPAAAAPRGSVAVRIPALAGLRSVIRAVGEPILSTSVNASGRAPLARIGDIRKRFPGLAAYLSRRGRAGAAPSTIVDFTGTEPRLVRRGKYPWPSSARSRSPRAPRGRRRG